MTYTDEKIDLVINQLTQSQYDQAKLDGDLNANELYVTETLPPSKTSDLVNDSGFITASAIPSNVGAFTNDAGYLTASSSEFVAKRDWSDMTAAEGTTYAPWMLSELDGLTADPAIPLNWKTFNISGMGETQGWVSEVPVATDLYCVIRPEYSNLYEMYKELNGSYTIMMVTPITFSEDGLSITSYDGDPSAITCSRSSSSAIPIQTTLATTLDIEGFDAKRDYQDITYPASIDNTGKYSIDHFTLANGASTAECDQFTQGSGTSTWRDISMNYSIATTDGTNFTLSDTTFGGSGPFTIDGYPSQIEVQVFNTTTQSQIQYETCVLTIHWKHTTFALKDYVDGNYATTSFVTTNYVTTSYVTTNCATYSYVDTVVGSINTALDTINGEVI